MFLAKNAIPCYFKHPLKPKTWYTPPFVVLEVFAPLANNKLMKQPGVHSPTGLLLSPRHQFPDLSRTQSGIAAAAGHTHNHHG